MGFGVLSFGFPYGVGEFLLVIVSFHGVLAIIGRAIIL